MGHVTGEQGDMGIVKDSATGIEILWGAAANSHPPLPLNVSALVADEPKVIQYVAIPARQKRSGFIVVGVRNIAGKGKDRLLRGKRAKRGAMPYLAYEMHGHHRTKEDALAHANALNMTRGLPLFVQPSPPPPPPSVPAAEQSPVTGKN